MIGILTEKPSQMRKFAKALGGSSGVYKGEQYVLACAREIGRASCRERV